MKETTAESTIQLKPNHSYGIDLLKFLALLLIFNSHIDIAYGSYRALATGGAIGDVLFFFCSGFTLFLRPKNSISEFPNWYKKRISRIFPSVFAVAIIRCLFFDTHDDIITVIISWNDWFIPCIMMYYVIIYIIGVYARQYITHIIIGISVIGAVYFAIESQNIPYNMYGNTYLKWILFFNFMLMGAKMGICFPKKTESLTKLLIQAFAALVLYYVFYFIGQRSTSDLRYIQFISYIPLFILVQRLFMIGEHPKAQAVFMRKRVFPFIAFIGGLCLEVYLVQYYLITDRLNHLFPLNILLIFAAVVITAYFARCLARIIRQTFQTEPYNWREVVKMY